MDIYVIIVIIMIMIMTIATFIVGFFAYMNKVRLNTCMTTQSDYCYTVTCPCGKKEAPCFGYTQKTGPDPGTFLCSNEPSWVVDKDGNKVRDLFK